MNSDSRPNAIDYAKAIGIYLVVLGHYTYAMGIPFHPSAIWTIMHSITLFHMPFFFMVSGMLYKDIDFNAALKKGWERLLRPYLLLCLLGLLIGTLFSTLEDRFHPRVFADNVIGILTVNDFIKGRNSYTGALWFCFSLFLIQITYSFCRKNAKFGGVFYSSH